MGRAPRSRLQRLADRRRDVIIADLARGSGTRLVVKIVYAIARIAIAPCAGCVRTHIQLRRDLLVIQPARRRQYDTRPLRQCLRSPMFAGQS
jgi:hypothetical protein